MTHHEDGGRLTPTQAAERYERLTGKPTRRQLWQQMAAENQIKSMVEVRQVEYTLIPASEVERLAREGLPQRKPGRPRTR